MIYFFYGQEKFLAQEQIEKIKNKLIPEKMRSVCARNFERIDFDALISAICALPMLFPKLLTLIDCSNYLIGQKKTLSDKEMQTFSEALKNTNENNTIIFYCINSENKLDKRSKFFKLLDSLCSSTEFNQFKIYEKSFYLWVEKQAKLKGLSFKKGAIDYFIKNSGTNLEKINSELEKLKLILAPNNEITLKDVEENCYSIQDVFSLADYIIEKNYEAAFRELKSLLNIKHPIEILAGVNASLLKYTKIKIAEAFMSQQEISRKFNLHEYVVKLNLQKLSKVSLRELVRIKTIFYNAEYEIKSGKSQDIEMTVEKAVLSV